MRAFIAIELDPAVKEYLFAQANTIAAACRRGNVTPQENLHLTLHFLGEITPDDVEDAVQAMWECAIRNRPFSLTLDRLGHFDRGRDAVIWAGVKKEKYLDRLYETLERSLQKNGFAREKKTLTPHITLMRQAESTRPFSQILSKIPLEAQTIPVTSIIFMESIRRGPKLIYRPITKIELGNNKNKQ